MATGDATDIAGRIRAVLPPWFGDSNPVLEAVIGGISSAFAFVYALYQYTVLQSRILTSTGAFLDIVSLDFYGGNLPRLPGELDAAFLVRIRANFFKERGTRRSIVQSINAIPATIANIIEFQRPTDTGGYGMPGFAYSASGFYGSRTRPYQAIVQVLADPGISNQALYDAINAVRPAGTITYVGTAYNPYPSLNSYAGIMQLVETAVNVDMASI